MSNNLHIPTPIAQIASDGRPRPRQRRRIMIQMCLRRQKPRNPQHDSANYPVLDLPYLILMKLMANRTIDIGDMTRMLGLASAEQIEQIETIVAVTAPKTAKICKRSFFWAS